MLSEPKRDVLPSKPVFLKWNLSLYCHLMALTIDFCSTHNINCIIRGIRDSKDLSFEQPIALANRDMKPDIDTIFLLADPKS